jgi:glyoxylase-like metal-dependent hydrolase (beta-lactamase superfamily II)
VKLKIAVLVLVALLSSLAWTFVKRPLPVPDATLTALPAAGAVDGVRVSIIGGAEMSAQEGFMVRGGSLMKPFITSIVAFVVEHPRGTLLIDAGVGRDVGEHYEATPLLMRTLAELSPVQATVDALDARGIAPEAIEGIVLTHAHWDHVSGVDDLRSVPLWMTPEELAFARTDEIGGELYRRLEASGPLELRELRFAGVPYGPFESSLDFFDDGSVIIVPMPGHTPGSVGVFVTDAEAKRVFLIGDTSWTKEGVDWPAEKPWLAKRLADSDAAGLREQLVLLNQLQGANPELLIVPAHDKRVHAQIAEF